MGKKSWFCRNFGDWLNIWNELTTNYGKQKSFNKMIGNIELLTSFSNGKQSYGLYIPLNFWFCQDSGLALPLVAMIHNDIKLHVEFNDFENTYIESPTNYIKVVEPFCLFQYGELIKQNINGNLVIGEFIYYDNINQYIYYNKLVGDFLIPTTNDPRYKMALTVDVRPGAIGRAANALMLDTDAQGHPQMLRPDGIVKRLSEEFKRFRG